MVCTSRLPSLTGTAGLAPVSWSATTTATTAPRHTEVTVTFAESSSHQSPTCSLLRSSVPTTAVAGISSAGRKIQLPSRSAEPRRSSAGAPSSPAKPIRFVAASATIANTM